jgi:subtilisin family serine protease
VIRVGLIDSGVSPEQTHHAVAARSFTGQPLVPDPVGHGTAVAAVLLKHCPDALILNAQTFQAAPASADAVARALDWLIQKRAAVANLSFGLRDDRALLRAAVARALDAGLVLLASVPARGPLPYPSAYSGVIRITGDARCAPGQLSALGGDPADYGACVLDTHGRPGGASLAVGHATGLLAQSLADGATEPRAALDRRVAFEGRERRV